MILNPAPTFNAPVWISRNAAAAQPKYMTSTMAVVSTIRNSNIDAMDRLLFIRMTRVNRLVENTWALRGVPFAAALPMNSGNRPSRARAAGSSAWHMIHPFNAPSALIAPIAAIAVPALVPA